MQNLNTKTVTILGFFTFIMIIAISCLLIWKSELILKTNGYKVIGEFQNVGGLLEGGEVRYRGYKVGRVSKIIPGPKSIKVYFLVESGIKIPKNSRLRIVFDGLIGEKYLALLPNEKETEMITSNDILQGYASAGLADFVEVGTQNLEQSKLILEAIRSVIASPEVTNSMRNSFIQMASLIQNLDQMTQSLRQATNGDEIKNIITNINEVSSSLKKTTDILFKQGNLPKDILESGQNIKEITNNLKKLSADNGLFNNTGKLLKTVSSIRSGYDLNLSYNNTNKQIYYNLNTDMGLDNKFVNFGISDRHQNTAINAQVGSFFTDNLAAKAGFFYSQPGMGLNWYLNKQLELATEFYDFNQPKLNLTGKYNIAPNVGLSLGVDNLLSNQKDLSLGISLSSEHQPEK